MELKRKTNNKKTPNISQPENTNRIQYNWCSTKHPLCWEKVESYISKLSNPLHDYKPNYNLDLIIVTNSQDCTLWTGLCKTGQVTKDSWHIFTHILCVESKDSDLLAPDSTSHSIHNYKKNTFRKRIKH